MKITNDFVIEKNIPIPNQGRKGKWTDLANKMQFGDSVLFPKGFNTGGLRNAINKIEGARAISRKVQNGLRVWKVPEGVQR